MGFPVRYHRVVNDFDVVPHLPPKILNYAHIGTEYYYEPSLTRARVDCPNLHPNPGGRCAAGCPSACCKYNKAGRTTCTRYLSSRGWCGLSWDFWFGTDCRQCAAKQCSSKHSLFWLMKPSRMKASVMKHLTMRGY